MKLRIIFTVFAWLPIICLGNQPIWKNYNETNGLPVQAVTAFAQTPDGLMWIGTQEGLFLFDGRVFKKVPHTALATEPYIEAMVIDKHQTVWCATRQGLLRVNRDSLTLNPASSDTSLNLTIKALVWNEDSSQLIFAGHFGIISCEVKNKELTAPRLLWKTPTFKLFFKYKKLLFINEAQLIEYSANRASKALVVCNIPGLINAEYDATTNQWVLLTQKANYVFNPTTKKMRLFGKQIKQNTYGAEQFILFDKQNELWINTTDAIYKFKSLTDTEPNVYSYSSKNSFGIPMNTITLFNDKDGNMWLASGQQGLSVLMNNRKNLYFTPTSELTEAGIWYCYIDTGTQYTLYGTQNSLVIQDKNNKIFSIKKPNNTNRFCVVNINSFDSEHWLILTYGAGAWLLNKRTFTWVSLGTQRNISINHAFKLNDNDILLASIGTVYVYNRKYKTLTNWCPQITGNVFFIEELDSHSLCISSSAGFYFTDKHANINKYYNLYKKKNFKGYTFHPMQTKRVKNKVFIATMNAGIWQYDLVIKKFEPIILSPNPNIVYCITDAGKSKLIFSGSSGLHLVETTTQKTAFLNAKNNLPFSNFEQFGAFASASQLVFVGPMGILKIDKQHVSSVFYDSIKAKVQYQNKIVDAITVDPGIEKFSAEVFTHYKNINMPLVYSYKLEGLEKEAHQTTDGIINYNYVPPGSYQLLITISSEHGNTLPATLSIPITISPLWYQTYWFKLICLALGIVLIIYAVRYFSYIRLQWNLRKMEAQQKVTEERLRISRELHDNIGSQLTYLVTGLETSEYLLDANKEQQLKSNIGELQQSARESMQQLRDSIWALNAEEMKLSLLAERFKNWAQKLVTQAGMSLLTNYDLKNDNLLDSNTALNIYRILQEALNNCIKHANAQTITINIIGLKNTLYFELIDDGIGITNQPTTGNGLINMKARAAQINATCEIKGAAQKGTKVTLIITQNMQNG